MIRVLGSPLMRTAAASAAIAMVCVTLGAHPARAQADGPRTVVFDIGGTIRLATPLTIRHGRITLAGQTAPGGGVTLRDHALVVAADDVVVRHIRSRLGDES